MSKPKKPTKEVSRLGAAVAELVDQLWDGDMEDQELAEAFDGVLRAHGIERPDREIAV